MAETSSSTGSSSPPGYSLQIVFDGRINYAMQQNDVPVIKKLSFENPFESPLRDVIVRISAEPEFAPKWETRIDLIAPNSIYNLNSIDLMLSPRFLGELTERVSGLLHFEFLRDSEPLVKETRPVKLLARDEWGGLNSLPEILAAFVLPNHPIIERVLVDAASTMGKWTNDPSLAGYQRKDPKRTYQTVGAIYTAIRNLQLTYINPPASFEGEGQRIRLPDRVLDTRMGTCLDLAVFSAACLEQVGLNPLVVIVKGHAFTGCWLKEECFPEPAVEDALRLRKRVDLNEICVFDPTCVTARPAPGFEVSVFEAKHRLENAADFLCVIDIKRARIGHIRPLPERADILGTPPPESSESSQAPVDMLIPELPGLGIVPESESAKTAESIETPGTRLEHWRRKLLDLSLRNKLLNFRETKKNIPILCPNLPALEDALAGGAIFGLRSNPVDYAEGDPRDVEIHRQRTGKPAIDDLLREEMARNRLCSELKAEELERRLVEIYRAARLGLEEGGASGLYLALGFLAWYETPSSEERRIAPILLLPLELHRKSAREGFTISLGDDEPRLNVTLLEMLSKDHDVAIPLSDPLPEDESGLDVPQILQTFRRAIRDIDKWDVLEIARIGLFSFKKFLMWRDLTERTEDLLKNKIVDHLVNRPEQFFDDGGTFPNPSTLDRERPASKTYCPLPADSSQMTAIFSAADGRSFVLEGPPGTGKSQTIANLIAHCLTEGKTILFVSEKMAALNVVHTRLKKVGLARFSLELHSNKAHKKEVIAQLEESLGAIEGFSSEEWEREARRLEALRNELNDYVEALHVKRGNGDTIFRALSRLIGLRNAKRVNIGWSTPDALNAESLAGTRDLVARIASIVSSCGEICNHPLIAVRKADWTPTWEDKVSSTIDRLERSSENLLVLAKDVSEIFSLTQVGWSLKDLELLNEISGAFISPPSAPAPVLLRPDWEEINAMIGTWLEHGRRRDTLRSSVYEKYTDKILRIDIDALLSQLQEADRSWFIPAWLQRRSIKKVLRGVSKSGISPEDTELASTLSTARDLKEEHRKLSLAGDEARALLGRYWKDGEPEWDGLEHLKDWAHNFRSLALRAVQGDPLKAPPLRETWTRLLTESREQLDDSGGLGRRLIVYRDGYLGFLEARKIVDDLMDIDTPLAWGLPEITDTLGLAQRTIKGWKERLIELRSWCAWRRIRLEGIQAGLTPLLEACVQGDIGSEDLAQAFDRSYYQWWIGAILENTPALSRFTSPEHETKIQQFKELDERYSLLTRSLIQARLGQKIPMTGPSPLPTSEPGILMREMKKKSRHMSTRMLFQKIPNLLPLLKPCLLMSPLSVAQYLDAAFPPFDIVVFDEASQIPVWDAVGAIARGRQAVIVGDPKQLPPTSFFERIDDSEDIDDTGIVEDLESILDDCIGSRIPSLRLLWHYRSRHESLIAFSNYHYYENRLLTFPSANVTGIGVSFRHVPDGIYDKGKSRTNRTEAEAVVAEIVRRLKNGGSSKPTIGVVTFNLSQQMLIEDLLDQVRKDDPEIEQYFQEDINEPVFVKNLESVQGDERDIILFSICFGPDYYGRISMNFGPMNKEGGERRLNVAITRARREVVVFSSMRAGQIDLSRTRARGVQDLKSFLEYAEKGPSALAGIASYNPDADFDSPFEKEVWSALCALGWQVHLQVGCSGYRIDLAVVDPENSGRYLLGIECDGANYHRAKTARDRDRIREAILRDLGWELHRIWSTDWWTNPGREVEKIKRAIERASETQKKKHAEPPPPTHFDMKNNATDEEQKEQEAMNAGPTLITSAPLGMRDSYQGLGNKEIYQPLQVDVQYGTIEDFYAHSSGWQIRDIFLKVVEIEAPILIGLAVRRVMSFWGMLRLTRKAEARALKSLPKHDIHIQQTPYGTFLWRQKQSPEGYAIFRVPGSEPESMRTVDYLPIEEIANLAREILKQQISLPMEDLEREMARPFGFDRTSQAIASRMRAGINCLLEKGTARMNSGIVSLNNG